MQVVFFVNIIKQARCIRRISDFTNRGYQVKTYGFDRDGDNRKSPNIPHEIIGQVSRTSSYFTRLMMMRKAIKRTLKSQANDAVYYLFSLDVAFAFFLAGGKKKRYIYEISDVMELEVSNKLLSTILRAINCYIINRSFETVMTSPGFVGYYFGNKVPSHISILPNKLNKAVLSLPKPRPKLFNPQELTIGFTGAIRNKAIYNFIEIVGQNMPNVKLRFHGIFTDDKIYGEKIKNAIEKYDNIEYLGAFKNPDDFPEIYSNIDLVLCLYTASGNDKILEPNKLYESIFFEKPIIVSKNTFTGDYVEEKGIGYAVNGESTDDVISLLKSITTESYLQRVTCCASIPKECSVDNTDAFFDKLTNKLSDNY